MREQKSHNGQEPTSNAEKAPEDWSTGDEPMTGAQASYLKTLSQQTGTSADDDLSKAEASIRIDKLRKKAGLEQAGKDS